MKEVFDVKREFQ